MNARDPVQLRPGQERRSAAAKHLVDQGSRVRADVAALTQSARELIEEAHDVVRSYLEEKPYATLGAALGAGYVLGGGLPIGLMRTLFGVGGRLAVERVLHQLAQPAAHGVDEVGSS